MNRIIIENDEIIKSDIIYNYKRKENTFEISELILDINNNDDIYLNINNNDSKLIINFNIKDNIKLNLVIINKCCNSKIQYKYNLGKNAICNIEKLNIVSSIREMIIANLDSSSNFNYIHKSIAISKENYDYMIYHNGINSNSNIINNSVNEQGSIYYQISSFIPKNINGCTANQFNRIINNTDNNCEIRPNLYIDCDDVTANHSALIDKFSNSELFYLESKGIDKDTSIKMLTKGFLLSNIKNKEIIDIINNRFGGE